MPETGYHVLIVCIVCYIQYFNVYIFESPAKSYYTKGCINHIFSFIENKDWIKYDIGNIIEHLLFIMELKYNSNSINN